METGRYVIVTDGKAHVFAKRAAHSPSEPSIEYLQFIYLLGMFSTVFNFMPKPPTQREHGVEQHGNHARNRGTQAA